MGGDHARAKSLLNRAVALSREHGIEFILAVSETLLVWTEIQEASSYAEVDRLAAALANYESLGPTLFVPLTLRHIAECCVELGEVERGLAATDRGLKLIATTNERWIEAELHRLRGELCARASGRSDDAATALNRALTVARAQGARSFELRALESIVRLDCGCSDRGSGMASLAKCYGSFTEGLDTADLVRAASLLDTR